MAETLVLALAVYVTIGVLFAIAFALKGAGVVDEGAAKASIGFRILVVPSALLLWPLGLGLWIRARSAPSGDSL